MNAHDRELLDALNLRHARLEAAVASLRAELLSFNARFDPAPYTAASPAQPAVLPPPVPVLPPTPPLPATPPPVPAAEAQGPALEIQFGRWLARIGVVFALLTVIFFSVLAYDEFHRYIGPWAKLGFLTLVSSALIGAGLWLERSLTVYGRTLAGGGLACLYYTLYGATFVAPLHVISNPLLGGLLLLAWSGAVLVMAERRKSELLSIFAISLAYFSSAIMPGDSFSTVSDLILAVTAVVFLVRNAWTGLSYLCLFGTYLGFVRQIISARPGLPFDYDVIASGNFLPWAAYLTGAWIIFTAAIFLARQPAFDGGKRMAFLCLNNGAWAGFLIVAALLSKFNHLGDVLLVTGATLLAVCALARWRLPEARDVTGAYLAQGLALATGGLSVLYHGVTRGLILTGESVFLVAAGATSRHIMLRVGGALTALVGAAFLFDETFNRAPFPWWLTVAGMIAMSLNAALERSAPRRLASAVYSVLAVIFALRWIYGVTPDNAITLAIFVLAISLVGAGLAVRSGILVRIGLLVNLVGVANYLDSAILSGTFTWLNATGFALFVAQPAFLRRIASDVITETESWLVVLASSGAAWLFLSNSILAANSPDLTLGWALLALGLIIIGFAAGERRQRWCGLAILVAAFVRVAAHDFWGFSDSGKVLTFFALTVICLGLSFLYYKFADRLKEWL